MSALVTYIAHGEVGYGALALWSALELSETSLSGQNPRALRWFVRRAGTARRRAVQAPRLSGMGKAIGV